MKLILDTVTDFDCDEATAIANCNEIIEVLLNNDKKLQEGSISLDEWEGIKLGYTYNLEDYQAYMSQKGWTSIPELPDYENEY